MRTRYAVSQAANAFLQPTWNLVEWTHCNLIVKGSLD